MNKWARPAGTASSDPVLSKWARPGSSTESQPPAFQARPKPSAVQLGRWTLPQDVRTNTFYRPSDAQKSTPSQATQSSTKGHTVGSRSGFQLKTEEEPEKRTIPFSGTDVGVVDSEAGQRTSKARGKDLSFKQRGSLQSKNAQTPEQDYLVVLRERQKERERRRNRSLHLKKVVPDVFIPSLVTVGNLARLLNVKLGVCFLEWK